MFIKCFVSFRFVVVVLATFVPQTPNYTPALQHNQDDIVAIITDYFKQGYSNAEILGFLGLIHGVAIGMRTLKRWLNVLGLKRQRRGEEAQLEEIVSAILKEMNEYVGSRVGYTRKNAHLVNKLLA